MKHSQSHHIVETACEKDSLFITQLLIIVPDINIHKEINICVYSDLCWEQQLQNYIELCPDKWWSINQKEAIDLEYR